MSFNKKTIKDIPVDGRIILVRTDYNVPLDEEGNIKDDFRIRASIPTLKYLLKRGCKIVVISHMGRPGGVRNEKYSLEKVAGRLAEILGRPVRFVDDVKGDKVHQSVRIAPKNSVVVLENLRFYAEEEANDSKFAKEIAKASRAEYLVQDGFGAVHRAHASTSAITEFLPSVAGLLVEKECKTLYGIMDKPKRPFVALLGGAKVSDKIKVVKNLIEKADTVLIGGAMANTFLYHTGYQTGASKIEEDQADTVKEIINFAKKSGKELFLPTDVAVAKTVDEDKRTVVSVKHIEDDELALDIGDASIENFVNHLEKAKTVFWNGPMGYTDNVRFSYGSARSALALAVSKCDSVIGGGDTAEFAHLWAGKTDPFTHISTGGGAGLDLIAGKKLPGVDSLLD